MITKPSKAHYHCRIGELVKDEYTYKEAFEMVEKEYFKAFGVNLFKDYRQFINSNYNRRKKINKTK